MSADPASRDIVLEPADNRRLANLCGQFDEHLRFIEEQLGVSISNRANRFRIGGESRAVAAAVAVIETLFAQTATEPLNAERVHVAVREAGMEKGVAAPEEYQIKTRRGMIRARGANQRAYLKAINESDLSFGIGPAGTGKTYLAVACAVDALQPDEVRRLVLVRPAVEAGERLGFLPGDMSQKVDPYLRPMYDALYEMLGFERVGRLIDTNIIEIAPLAFMRGRTLNEAFVILDEAQNTTVEQMKMFLTRIGFGSRAVVTGDITQTDLPSQKQSGLRHVAGILRGVSGVSFTHFTARDVVRHPLVQRIVEAYESDQEQAPGPDRSAG